MTHLSSFLGMVYLLRLQKNIEWNVSLCSKNEFESYNEKSIKGIIQQMGHYSLLTHLSESAFDNMVFAFN